MDAMLTMGPVLFHWPADKKRDFYFRIADEAPVDTVYLGEVICSKRAPFFTPYYAEVVQRLVSGGKKVVFSSLAEVMLMRERKMTAELCAADDFEIEVNDAAALYHARGKPHRIGQYFNVYNTQTLEHLVGEGATHATLPAELSKTSIECMGEWAAAHMIGLEVQVYGRVGLALSARCYHARAHGRVKDNCQFVCEEDPDGMPLKTLGGQDFLCVNGVQTLSYTCLNLLHEIPDMQKAGIRAFRLSPQTCDMVKVAQGFADVLAEKITPQEACRQLDRSGLDIPYANGFYHGRAGYHWAHGPHA